MLSGSRVNINVQFPAISTRPFRMYWFGLSWSEIRVRTTPRNVKRPLILGGKVTCLIKNATSSPSFTLMICLSTNLITTSRFIFKPHVSNAKSDTHSMWRGVRVYAARLCRGSRGLLKSVTRFRVIGHPANITLILSLMLTSSGAGI